MGRVRFAEQARGTVHGTPCLVIGLFTGGTAVDFLNFMYHGGKCSKIKRGGHLTSIVVRLLSFLDVRAQFQIFSRIILLLFPDRTSE